MADSEYYTKSVPPTIGNVDELPQNGSELFPLPNNPHVKYEYDPRFPNQNQTRRCWYHYMAYWHCYEKNKDADVTVCHKEQRYMRAYCPFSWLESWDANREAGKMPGMRA